MFRFAAVTLAAAALTATTAMADFANYGETQGWTVFVDNSRDLCFAERVDAAGIVTHMNVVSLEDGIASMAVFVTDPNVDITDGTNTGILLGFDDGATFKGTLMEVAGLPDNYKGGVIQTDNADFLMHVREKEEMYINPTGDNPMKLSLAGTKAAMAMGRECLTEHHGG